MDRTDPTEKQAAVLRVYVEHFQAHQRWPTYVEAGGLLEMTPNAVWEQVARLKRKGWMESDGGAKGRVRVVGMRVTAELPDAPWLVQA